jgi:hypothetical protein
MIIIRQRQKGGLAMRIVKIVAVLFICILTLTVCTVSPDAEYAKAQKTDSIAAYQQFMEKHPGHPLSEKAQTRIDSLNADLFVAGIRQIAGIYKEASHAIPPWDEVLKNDKTNMFALALKGIAEAKAGHMEQAISFFQDAKQAARDSQLAPQIIVLAVDNKNKPILQLLRCPLPASVASRALLFKPNSRLELMKTQFVYMEDNGGMLFPSDIRVLSWKMPPQNNQITFSKIMDMNISGLQ